MKLFPAIDMIDEKIVRLAEGDFDQVTYYSRNVFDQAKYFDALGFKHLHIINLSGTLNPDSDVTNLLKRIKHETNLIIQFGGGIRSLRHVENLIDIGIDRIILSSLLFDDPEILPRLSSYQDVTFVAALDCRNRNIQIHGWKTDTGKTIDEFIPLCAEFGISDFLITDIKKDGLLQGPNFDLYDELNASHPNLEFIASGGVSSISEVKRLREMNLDSCIIGKAIYEGKIDMDELVSLEQADA